MANKIRELALKHGFKLKLQADGSHDLNKYVYDFADELIATKDPIIDNLLDRLNKARETGQGYLRETQQQRKELSDLRGSIKELYNTIQRQTTTIRSHQSTIARQATTIQEQQALIDMLSKSVNDQREELKDRQELIDTLNRDIKHLNTHIDRILVSNKLRDAFNGEKADGPGYEDGCDHEGFPGGCERMGHNPESHNIKAWMNPYNEAVIQASRKNEGYVNFSIPLVPMGAPIPMILHCPSCGEQHIDEGKWATTQHRSHLCHHCDHQWRPADAPTIGVTAIKTKGKLDSPTKMVKLVGPVVAKLRYLIQCSIYSKISPTRDLQEALRLIDKETK